jgi:hypothetical protein
MALLADTQYGFPGTVTPTAWASIIGNASGGVFGVAALGDLKLTANAVGDRGALLSTGTAYGHGCIGIWNSTTQFNFSAASGTSDRWDCVVVRRTWSNTPGVSVTTLAVKTGSSSKSLPSLVMTPGVQTEQPLWMVRVKGGQTAIQEIVDVRCFSANGGVQAMDPLAMGYLNLPGSRVEIGGTIYEYKANSTTSSAAWEAIGSSDRINLWNQSSTLQGTINSTTAPGGLFLMQAGSNLATTDANGYCRLTWPSPFPNGLLTVVAVNGDDFAVPRAFPSGAGGTAFGVGGKNFWTYRLLQADGDAYKNRYHRINWIAIGF